jgi:hypothetical protein
VNGVLNDDECRVLGAAHQLGFILSSDWPDVAAHLLAQGADGEAASELAGSPRTASPWSVDQLVPEFLAELAIPELPTDQAGDLVVRLFRWVAGTRPDADEFAAIRELPGILPHIAWITECPRVIYWGDIDAAGLAIVNSLRRNGLHVQTILMDRPTYDRFERFGARTDEKGQLILCSPRRTLIAITPDECALYQDLTDPEWKRVRRIEQERIPLAEAALLINPTAIDSSR